MNKFQGVYTRKKPSFLFSPPSSRGLLRAEFAIDAVPQSACSKMYFNVPSSQRTLKRTIIETKIPIDAKNFQN